MPGSGASSASHNAHVRFRNLRKFHWSRDHYGGDSDPYVDGHLHCNLRIRMFVHIGPGRRENTAAVGRANGTGIVRDHHHLM